MNYDLGFAALCPSCHCEVDQGGFPSYALRQFIKDRTLRFYCKACNLEWQPSEKERTSVESLLRHPLSGVNAKKVPAME